MLSALLWHAPLMLPIAIAVLATLAAFVLWLYPPQVRSLARRWRWLLPSLRMIALAALVISLIKPVLVRPRTIAEQGAVVLLIDRSHSMGVTDVGRTPAELVSLAAGLGLLPEGVRDEAIEQVRTQQDEMDGLIASATRALRELEYARLSSRGVQAAQERLDEATGQITTLAVAIVARAEALSGADAVKAQLDALDDVTAPLDESSLTDLRDQVQQAKSALTEMQVAADQRLHESDERVRSIADELAKLSRLALAQEGIVRGRVLADLPDGTPVYAYSFARDLAPLASLGRDATMTVADDGQATNLTGAIRAALDQVRGRSVQAIVVLSDGRQVGGDSAIASGLAPSGVPVFAVNVAGPLRRDVALVDVEMPVRLFVNETLTVRARLRGAGMRGQTVPVHLRSGDDVSQTKPARFGEDELAEVEFQVRFDDQGVRTIALSADAVEGEISPANNALERRVNVLADKVAVAAFSGSAGWDFQYVRNALSRTPWVTLADAIFRSGDDRLGMPPDALIEQAVVMLSDVAVTNLSAEQWDAVHRMVTERGGSVILMSGDPAMLAQFQTDVLLANLLPYRAGVDPALRVWPGEEPSFRLVPAPDAIRNPALRLSDDDDADPAAVAQRWDLLPGLFKYVPVSDLKPNALPLLIERESGDVVVTESRLGAGRVFFVGTDETWRWRDKVGERDHDRFWLQLIRHAADDPYAAVSDGVYLDADHVQIEPGKPLRMRAKVMQHDGRPAGAASQVVRVSRDGQVVREITMSNSGLAVGRYEAIVEDLPVGSYELRLTDAGRTATLPLTVAEATEAEMMDLSADEQLLRRLADSTGGQMLPLDQLRTLPARIRDVQRERSQVTEYRLWDSPYLFILVLGCLTAEWALRKRVGLV